ncbi:hypothetical protein [Bradyrhizobium sp. STM 3843]|uniref:hypothetical protein n=1 Tax=Bradyrhizobium sp. STM 3843 TaxID=551947 RepID=UPI001112942A|nr:hypothetical protein [Bradyrhizobium sp. STM 3843]
MTMITLPIRAPIAFPFLRANRGSNAVKLRSPAIRFTVLREESEQYAAGTGLVFRSRRAISKKHEMFRKRRASITGQHPGDRGRQFVEPSRGRGRIVQMGNIDR